MPGQVDGLEADKRAGEEKLAEVEASLRAANDARLLEDARSVELQAELASVSDQNADLTEALAASRAEAEGLAQGPRM